MIVIREINEIESLGGYRARWAELLRETDGASFFQSLEWLESYWRHFGQAQRLRVLMAENAGHVVGIVPLVVRHEPTRLGALAVLTYPLHDWGTFYGPIGSDPTALLTLALGHVKRTARDWDTLDLRWVDAEIDRGATAQAFERTGITARREPWNQCPQVELEGTWESYWASRTSRWRNNVRRSEKKLLAAGPLEYVRHRPLAAANESAEPRWDLYEACQKVAGESWQAASTTGTTLTHETIRAFLSDAHRAAATAGSLDMNLLLLAGRPVAFNYAYHYRGCVYGLRTGFSADPAADGAGSVLQMHMIRDSFARADRLYDLGPGYLACKRYWQTRVATSYRYTHFATGLRPQLVRAKRSIQGWFAHRSVEARKR